jgi:hypothetical protein
MMGDWRVLLLIAPLLLVAWVWRRVRRRGDPAGRRPARFGGVGPGAAGAFYEMLNEDRRRAIEIVVEQRAEKRDAEDADGNLPDLEHRK